MIRVLVAASTAISRAGLEAIVSREPGFVLVGGSSTLDSLPDDVSEHEPEVVLLELSGAPADDFFGTLQLLAIDADDGARLTPAIVLLSDEGEAGHLADALRAGVRALLPRDAAPHEILAALSAAAAGLVSFTRDWIGAVTTAQSLTPRHPENGGPSRQVAPSSRELEVLRMIADGLANKQIAARLGISEHTVKFHVASLFAKLGASTRAEAVMTGARRGLIVL